MKHFLYGVVTSLFVVTLLGTFAAPVHAQSLDLGDRWSLEYLDADNLFGVPPYEDDDPWGGALCYDFGEQGGWDCYIGGYDNPDPDGGDGIVFGIRFGLGGN